MMKKERVETLSEMKNVKNGERKRKRKNPSLIRHRRLLQREDHCKVVR